MVSHAGSTRRRLGTRFPTVHVRLISAAGRESKPSLVRLAVSNRLYWKPSKAFELEEPQSLADFRGGNSFVIGRFPSETTWEFIQRSVRVREDDEGPSVIVPGKIRGRARLTRLNAKVKLVLTLSNVEERNRFLEWFRVRVAPWQLLHLRMKELSALFDLAENGKAVKMEIDALLLAEGGGDVIRDLAGSVTSSESDEQPVSSSENSNTSDGTEKTDVLDRRLEESIATAVKTRIRDLSENVSGLASHAYRAATTSKHAADVTKHVVGLCSVFRLVGSNIQCVAALAETNHGFYQLREVLAKMVACLTLILESIPYIFLDSNCNAEEVIAGDVFRVLDGMLTIMGATEDYLLRGIGGNTMDAESIKELGLKVERLEQMAVVVMRWAIIGKRVQNSGHQPRPGTSHYFVGRSKELSKLKKLLLEHGSAAIADIGGIGKTEVMAAFADSVEREGAVNGGVYWVTANGEVEEFIHALSCLVQGELEVQIPGGKRDDPKLVVAALKRGLSAKKCRWLLCLDSVDNAGESRVVEVLSSVCSIANPVKMNGWVIVTSRQGRSALWNGMKREQKLSIRPLSEEDSMCLLWRYIHSIGFRDRDEKTFTQDFLRLQETNEPEYEAFKALCHSDTLRGLPLGLMLAGTYIRHTGCSFTEYVKLFREVNASDQVDALLEKSRGVYPLRDEQRPILTTWKIGFQDLSGNAIVTLRSLSLLANTPVPRALLKGILEKIENGNQSVEWKCQNLVRKELVHGSAMLRLESDECGAVFDMHRLVRLFVVGDLERGSEEWNAAFTKSLTATCNCVQQLLEREGCSFFDFPENFGSKHQAFIPHALAILNRFVRPASPEEDTPHLSMVQNLLRYTGTALQFFGRMYEAENVWQMLLSILQWRYGENSVSEEIAEVVRILANVVKDQGNMDEAESLHLRCVEMKRTLYGAGLKHHSIAMSLAELGNVYSEQGKWDQAAMMYQESLGMERAIHGIDANHPAIASALGQLGTLCNMQGKWMDATVFLRQCLYMNRAVHGREANNSDIACTLVKLGNLYRLHDKLELAESMYRQSLLMTRMMYGHYAHHPEIADILGKLGAVLCKQGNLSESCSMHRQCLDMLRSMYGPDANTSAIAVTLNSLGNVLSEQEKYSEAVGIYRQCLRMNCTIHGHDSFHPSTGTALNNLGNVYMKQGKLGEAVSMFVASRAVFLEVYGQDSSHPLTKMVETNLKKAKEEIKSKEGSRNLKAAVICAFGVVLALQFLDLFG